MLPYIYKDNLYCIQMRKIFNLISLFSLTITDTDSFILQYSNIFRGTQSHTRVYNLKKIDDELGRLRAKTGMLLRKKQQLLKHMTGMNFHNDSDIEAHLNRTFSKPVNDDDDEEPPTQPEEQVRFIIMNGFNQREGKGKQRNPNPFLDDDESEESDTKS